MKPILIKLFPLIFLLFLLSGCLLFYGVPELDIPDQTVKIGESLSLSLPDFLVGEKRWSLTSYHLAGDSAGTIDAETQTYTYTPETAADLPREITIIVSNGLRQSETTFRISAAD